jgi:hypothetical protein
MDAPHTTSFGVSAEKVAPKFWSSSTGRAYSLKVHLTLQSLEKETKTVLEVLEAVKIASGTNGEIPHVK